MSFISINEISAPELDGWMKDESKDFRMIDVREMMEIAQGSIEGAEPMPMSMLGNHIQEIEKDRPVVFICRSGARSGQVCAYLTQHGYENVYNLSGGVISWNQHGLPFSQVVSRTA